MASETSEPPTLRFIPSTTAVATAVRSYSCYNCNYSFHVTPSASTSGLSPPSFRCPQCHHRHLILHHTVPHPPPDPPPPSAAPPPRPEISNSTPEPAIFTYDTSDDFDSDSDYDYDSDNSLLSFTIPNLCSSTPALKSLVDSLPIKIFPSNSIKSSQSCSICLEDFDSDPDPFVTINELPCQHYFHNYCIIEWLNRSNTCPMCRYQLPVNPGTEEGAGPDPGPNQWEEEDFASTPLREPAMRRIAAQMSLSSAAEASGSISQISSLNWGEMSIWRAERSIWHFYSMRDDDGSTLMLDA